MSDVKEMKPAGARAWLMVVAFLCFGMFGMGLILSGVSPFVPTLIQDKGFAASGFTFWMTMYAVGMAISMPFVGRIITKIDPKICLGIPIIVCYVAFGLMSQYNELWQWYISGFIIGLSGGFFFMVPAPVFLSNWFDKHRAVAIAIAVGGTGLGGFWTATFGTWCIGEFGWRMTYIIEAVIGLVGTLPWALFLIKFKPEDVGQLPYGYDPNAHEDGVIETVGNAPGLPEKRILKSPVFYLLFIAAGCAAIFGGFGSIYSLFTVSIGLDAMTGALMVSVASIGVLCNPIIGWVNDKFGARVGVNSLLIIVLAGIVIIAWIAGTIVPLLLVGAFLLGMQGRIVAVEFPLILEAIFGRRELAKCYSYIQIGTGLVGGFGFVILSFPYDLTGSLYMSFLFGIVLALIIFCIVQFSFIYAKKHIYPYWEK